MKFFLKLIPFLFGLNPIHELIAADENVQVPAYVITVDDSKEIPARRWVHEVRPEVLSRWKGMTKDQQSQAVKQGYTYTIHYTNVTVTGPNFNRSFGAGEEAMLLTPGKYLLEWREEFSCRIMGSNAEYSNTQKGHQTFEARKGSSVKVTVNSTSQNVTYDRL